MLNLNQLCQVEIYVPDLDAAKSFYETVFGWKPSAAELHEYVVIDVPSDTPFGLALALRTNATVSEKSLPSNVVLYFSADDAAAFVDKVCKLGARLIFGPKKLPAYGQIYQIEDPFGVRWGVFQGES